jgi:hypothetical protein
MRKHRVICLVALASVAIAAPVIGPWTYYVALGLRRGDHFYHGVPTTYWRKAVSDYILEYTWARPPSLPVRLLRRLCPSSARPSILNGDVAAVPVLADLLQDNDGRVRTLACIALGEIGPPASPAFRQSLRLSRARPLLHVHGRTPLQEF